MFVHNLIVQNPQVEHESINRMNRITAGKTQERQGGKPLRSLSPTPAKSGLQMVVMTVGV